MSVEVRAADDERGPVIAGHAAVFNSPSLDLGGFREVIDPKAFKRTLREKQPIRSYFNHSPMHVLGRTDNKTLTVRQDEDGIAFEVIPPDTQWARDLMVSMKRGDIRDASFAFKVVRDAWTTGDDGTQVRTLLDVDLLEVGPVAQGAYPSADSAVRSMLEARGLTLGDDNRVQTAEPEERAAPDMGAMMARMDAMMSKMDDMMDQMAEMMDGKSSAARSAEPPIDNGWQIRAAHRRRTLELMQLR